MTEDLSVESEVELREVNPCPSCGELILAVAQKCRHCGAYLDPVRRAVENRPGSLERLLTPVGRPASAIAAGYLGLFSLFPLMGPVALIMSIVALRTLRRNPELSGRGRAVFGLIMGSIATLFCSWVAVMLAIESWEVAHGRIPWR